MARPVRPKSQSAPPERLGAPPERLGAPPERLGAVTERLGAAPGEGGRLLRALDGYAVDMGLLGQALAHRSYCAEAGGLPSNERLELLGDAVLGLVVVDHLYRTYPDLPEGDLARLQALVVSTEALAPVAADLGVGEAVLLGKGEEHSGGRQKESILADCLEAIIGAVYLSAGLAEASRLVTDLLGSSLATFAAEGRLGDPKNRLQEAAAKLGFDLPVYRLEDRGPDHAKTFTAEVLVAGAVAGRGTGPSKKHAERAAALSALPALEARAGGC